MKLLLPLFIILLVSCKPSMNVEEFHQTDQIRINQLGYYPQSIKEFVVADLEASSFQVVDKLQKIRHKGELKDQGTWDASGEKVFMGDFTRLSKPGTYRILLNTGEASFPFEIKAEIYNKCFDVSYLGNDEAINLQ